MKEKVNNFIKEIMKDKNKLIPILVITLYIIIILVISINHELSQDEIQSWLISRDLNFVDIIKQMKYEGHSFLWHYLLTPLSKIGMPIESQKIIPFIFAIATIIILWKNSPFKTYMKILLTFSSGMIYYYSVFCRPYCLIPFLLVCIASIYKDRQNHPILYCALLGLLANTHLVMLPTVALLGIDYFWQEFIKKRQEIDKNRKVELAKAFTVLLVLSLILIIAVLAGMFNNEILNKNDAQESIGTTIFSNIVNAATASIMLISGKFSLMILFAILMLIEIVLCIICARKSKKQGIIFFAQFLGMFIIHVLWFPVLIRLNLVIYTLMFWVWVHRYDIDKNEEIDENKDEVNKINRMLEIALILMIVIFAIGTYVDVYQDLFKDYTAGKQMAEYIEENLPEDSVFIYAYPDLQHLIIGYLPNDTSKYRFYSITANKFVTFSTWDKGLRAVRDEEKISEAIKLLGKDNKNIYLINMDYNVFQLDKIKYVTSTEKLYATDVSRIMHSEIQRDELLPFVLTKLNIDEKAIEEETN